MSEHTISKQNRTTTTRRASNSSQEPSLNDVASEISESFRTYAKERPEVVAMWCFGVGFVLGWKLKPW